MRKITAFFVILFLFVPAHVFAEACELKIICLDENKNVLDTYEIYGGQYEEIRALAPQIEDYTIVGVDYKLATFGINLDVKFIYTKTNINQKNYQLHKKYINGFGDGIFLPDKEITWSEAIVMLYNIYEIYKEDGVMEDKNLWYGEAFNYFIDIGFGEFFDERGFEHDKPLSRYEFISLASLYVDNFSNDNVIDAFLQINNMDRLQSITRAEGVWIINMLLGRDNEIENSDAFKQNFIDVQKTHEYYYSILEAAETHECINDDGVENWIGRYSKASLEQ